MLARGEPRIRQLLGRVDVELLEPRDLGARRTEIPRVDERGAVPQVERPRQQRDGRAQVTNRVRVASEHDEPLEPLRVELVGFDAQEIAVGSGRQPATRDVRGPIGLERAAQLGDVHPQRGRRAGRWIAFPQLFDQLLARDRAIRAHREEHQQLPRLRTSKTDRRAVVTHLERAEHANLHAGASTS